MSDEEIAADAAAYAEATMAAEADAAAGAEADVEADAAEAVGADVSATTTDPTDTAAAGNKEGESDD